MRVILEHAGVRDVLSKRFGTNNTLVNAQAVMRALQRLRGRPASPEAEEQSPRPAIETVVAEPTAGIAEDEGGVDAGEQEA